LAVLQEVIECQEQQPILAPGRGVRGLGGGVQPAGEQRHLHRPDQDPGTITGYEFGIVEVVSIVQAVLALGGAGAWLVRIKVRNVTTRCSDDLGNRREEAR
jgi:hypothetical protein